MHEYLNFFLESNTLAFIVSLAIFFITIILVLKRAIGFFITLLLLVFALVSGFFVANQDLLRGFLHSFSQDGGSHESSSDSYALFKQQLERSYQELKDDFFQQKKEFGELFDKIRTHDKESKEEPSSTTTPANGKK